MTKSKATNNPSNQPFTFGVIGNGSWATALVKMLTDNGHPVHWWMRNEESLQHMLAHHHNPHYLSSVSFEPTKIKPSSDLEKVIAASSCLLICIPSAYVMDVLQALEKDALKGKKIVSAIKGILPEAHQLLHSWLQENFQVQVADYFAITGPCHAEEVAAEKLSYLSFVGEDLAAATAIASCFANYYIRTQALKDIWGAQVAAVLKNIYAVGAGIAHGLDYGDNFLSVYITNCFREMHLVLVALFKHYYPAAPQPDFMTSAYLGDLLVTCYSLHSRNRSFGNMIGKGYSVHAAILEMKMVAEGYAASKGVQEFLEAHQLQTPIATAVYNILWEGRSAQTAFKNLEPVLR